jgi:hypothetical protein
MPSLHRLFVGRIRSNGVMRLKPNTPLLQYSNTPFMLSAKQVTLWRVLFDFP